MFRGQFNISVDAKGRLVIPAKYRERLQEICGGDLVITIDPTNNKDRCLFVYPVNEWEKIQAEIDKLPSFNKQSRKVSHLLVSNADDVSMDGNGRVLVSSELRTHAGIEKNATLVGQGKKFELWNDEAWSACMDAWLDEASDDESDLPEALTSLSL